MWNLVSVVRIRTQQARICICLLRHIISVSISAAILERGERSRGVLVSPVWCWGGGAPSPGSGGHGSWCRPGRWRGCAEGHWICPSQTSLSAELPRSPAPACRTSGPRESRQIQRLHCKPHNIFPGQPATTKILRRERERSKNLISWDCYTTMEMDKVISATDTLNKQKTEKKHLSSKLDCFNISQVYLTQTFSKLWSFSANFQLCFCTIIECSLM